MIAPFNKYGLTFRTVVEEDAAFILELRNNELLSRFLSPTNNDVEQQKEWIRAYKQREEQNEEVYFVSLDDKGDRLGLNRLYNYDKNSFEIGSWIYKPGLDMSVAILGDLTARDYGFETLGFLSCRFRVRKINVSVIKYHLGFNPQRTGESELDYYFELGYDGYKIYRNKLLKMLTNE